MRKLAALLLAALALVCSQIHAELPLAENDMILFYGGGMVERLLENGELEARVQLAHPGRKLRVRSVEWTGDEVGWRLRPEGSTRALQRTTGR